jgi:hypothetical protein
LTVPVYPRTLEAKEIDAMPPLASRIVPLLVLSLLVLAAPPPAFAGIDRWTLYGPTGSGLSDVVVDPRSPDRMWIAAGTVYKSEDGGRSFHPSANGLEEKVIWSLAIDPGEPDVLYASGWANGSGVFRSQDGGAHWSPMGDRQDFLPRPSTSA